MSDLSGPLRDSVAAGPSGAFQLPWPMTDPEAFRWFGVLVPALVASTAVVAWVTTAVTDPSAWRLLVPLAWLLLFKSAVLPLVAGRLRPNDVDARWQRWAAQSTGQDGQHR